MINKILVPTDFSPLADNALKYAGELCKHTKAELVLLHVLQINSTDLQMPAAFADEIMTEQQKVAQTKLDTAKAFVRHTYGVSVEGVCTFGAVAEEIADYATQNSIDLVVMSTHGITNFLDRILGTNTSTTILRIQTPLLVIPKEVSYKEIQKVVVATDYSGSEMEYLNFVHNMTQNMPVAFHFLHVNSLDTKPNKSEIDEELTAFSPNIHFHEVLGADVVKSVKAYIDTNHIDLLALRHHERSFFSELFHTSIAKELSHITNLPMLVFHDKI